MRTVSAVLLLTIGIPVLLAGGSLWMAGSHRDDAGAFTGALERLETSGHAVVVPDLAALLRREAPFLQTSGSRLRITARTGSGPAFLGIATTAEVSRYLVAAPHVRLDRVSVTRGRLPVRLVTASGPRPGTALAPPATRTFWQQSATGFLDIDPRRLRERSLSLVIMRPDGGAGIGADVAVEARLGWLDPTMWGLLAGGVVLVLMAAILLTRPIRPREVVFVVEPNQVPVLAARLGVATLDPVTGVPAQPGPGEAVAAPPAPQPFPESAPQPLPESAPQPLPQRQRRSTIRPASLAELIGVERPTAPVAANDAPPAWPTPDIDRIVASPRPSSSAPRARQNAPSPSPSPSRPQQIAPLPPPPPLPPPMSLLSRPTPAGSAMPAKSPILVGSPIGSPRPAGSPIAGATEPSSSDPVGPVRSVPAPARLRPSVPVGSNGSVNAATVATRTLAGSAASGRPGQLRPTGGRHHAPGPVLPVRSAATPPAPERRNMRRTRWWNPLDGKRTGDTTDGA